MQNVCKFILTSPSCSSQSNHNVKAASLRNKCDNLNCLKWRKLNKDLAKNITEDAHWTCDMNEDPHFSSCDVPEEDTYSYDKLAKKVKLDLIKSELKPGTLVWAKMIGYCRWPAIVTADPLNGLHGYRDDFEVLWYHVEFLGGNRTHGWVGTNSIEVFGPGNIADPMSEKQSEQIKKSKKRKRSRSTCNVRSRRKEKNTYKGITTVNKAISEAMELLSVTCDERLKTCWFVQLEDVNFNHADWLSDHKRAKKKKKFSSGPQKNDIFDTVNRRHPDISLNLETHTNPKVTPHGKQREAQHVKPVCLETIGIKEDIKSTVKSLLPKMNQKVDLSCLQFQSSLLNTSKEERFITDLQIYMKNEKAFDTDVTRFMKHNSLKLAANPVWQNIEVSLYSLFLAVNEREGFLQVCERHQWSSVYAEVSQHNSRNGGSTAKKFYKKNLYVYELYIKGLDYSNEMKELTAHSKSKLTKMSSVSSVNSLEESISNVNNCSQQEDEEFDNPDVIKQLDELNQILKSLEKDENNENEGRVVPVFGEPIGHIHTRSPVFNAMTGSFFGEATEPDEKAQVVPELDFPSSLESSQSEHVYHEMQALHHEMDNIQEELDVL